MTNRQHSSPQKACFAMTLGLAVLLGMSLLTQNVFSQTEETGETARLLAQLVEDFHISHHKIDDEISKKFFHQYLKNVDSQKLYFQKPEIDAWAQSHETSLDDEIRHGETAFAFEIYNQYLANLQKWITRANYWIDTDHDFTVDETIAADADDIEWAKNEAELDDRWRRRIKYELLDLKLEGTVDEEAKQQLKRRYYLLQKLRAQTKPIEILELYLSSLTYSFDPHSSYMSQDTLNDFQINMRLSLEGIGAALQFDDGYTLVKEIVKGGAAEKEGSLKVGDKIVGVAQADGEFQDIVEMKLKNVVKLIRGRSGSVVRLKVKPGEGGEIKTISLVRQKIELADDFAVSGEIINTKDRIGRSQRVGVIKIPSFYRDFAGAQSGVANFKSTERDLQKVLQDFDAQGGADIVIIDLRWNGGGSLSEAIGVTGLFIDQGPVVQVKEMNQPAQIHSDENSKVAYRGPLVVVCNRASASASEIFAGAIKDYGRGIVVGDTTTHGKGTVQNVMPVSAQRMAFRFLPQKPRGAVKLTIQQFYRVNGDSTQHRGVRSDLVLPSKTDHIDYLTESSLDNALPFDQTKALVVPDYQFHDDDMIAILQKNSQKRVTQNEEFIEIQGDIDNYLKRKNRKNITLNEEKFMAENKLSAEQEAKEIQGVDDKKEEEESIFPVSAYNDELLDIAVDYFNLLKQRNIAAK